MTTNCPTCKKPVLTTARFMPFCKESCARVYRRKLTNSKISRSLKRRGGRRV